MGSLLLRIAGFAVLNAISVLIVVGLWTAGEWLVALVAAAVTLGLNLIYLGPWAVPAKYLAPGVILLVIFQLFLVVYSGFVSFTNYGLGHLGDKEAAIAALTRTGLERVPDSPRYPLTVLDRAGTLAFLLTVPEEGGALVGDATTPLAPAPDAEFDERGIAVGLAGYRTLSFGDILGRQAEVLAMAVPVSDVPSDGVVQTPDGRTAYVYRSVRVYDPARDAMVDTRTGTLYVDNGRGNFVGPDGELLQPGWRAVIGLDNYQRVIDEVQGSGQLVGVFAWTFAFAFLSVLTAFGLGVFLALVFNDARLRGQRIYRLLLMLPYAFPVFLSVLIWGGMLNPQFGFINTVLLGGADIPWLQDPWLARFSVLMVSLWLEFPYWFLVATGALQSVPREMEEAAVLDGANRWRLFRSIRLPLLLVTMAPLLVSAFAFAFNNFNLIWLLTRGGPVALDSDINAGATDILITATYKIAFFNTFQDYGLASALATVIFMIVAAFSVVSFRRTKRYEEVL